MASENFQFEYEVFDSIEDLSNDDGYLLQKARDVTKFAYAPYSNFRVGAYARLGNGKEINGTNQENAAYPAGICAERTLISAAASLFPGETIETIAISYLNENGKSDKPVSPCGICRQSLVEFQQRTSHPIRIILSGMTGKVIIVQDAKDLLPLMFSADDMK